MAQRKNEAAAALGRRRAQLAGSEEMRRVGLLGAAAGGEARARSLSSARKRAIAKKAAAARWGKKKGKGKKG